MVWYRQTQKVVPLANTNKASPACLSHPLLMASTWTKQTLDDNGDASWTIHATSSSSSSGVSSSSLGLSLSSSSSGVNATCYDCGNGGWAAAYFVIGFLVLAATTVFTTWFYARRGTPRSVLATASLAMYAHIRHKIHHSLYHYY